MQARAYCTAPINDNAGSPDKDKARIEIAEKKVTAAEKKVAAAEKKIARAEKKAAAAASKTSASFSSFHKYPETVANLMKLASIHSIELEDKLGDTMVIPQCSRTSAPDFQSALNREVAYLANSLCRILQSLDPSFTNEVIKQIFINPILISVMQLMGYRCKFSVDSLHGAANYHIKYEMHEFVILEAKEGLGSKAISQLAQVLTELMASRLTLTKKLSREVGSEKAAEELVQSLPSYGALTSGDAWMFCCYRWVKGSYVFSYTPVHYIKMPGDGANVSTEEAQKLEKSLTVVLKSLVAMCEVDILAVDSVLNKVDVTRGVQPVVIVKAGTVVQPRGGG